MARIIDDEVWACNDCTMIICNDDASGMDDATEKQCRDGIERLQASTPGGYLASNSDGDSGEGYEEFSHDSCDICGALAGSRHRFALLGDGHPMKCDQCQMLAINGVNTHEIGCPNHGKTWNADEGEWVRFLKCHECGCDVREGDTCDCQENDEEEDDENDDEYKCPQCGETDLDVSITCWAKLYQEDGEVTGTVTDESHDGTHEWDDDSQMRCNGCDHAGTVKEFRNE